MSVATARKLAVVTGSETAGEGEAHEAISELARQVSEAGTGLLGAKGCECVLESPQLIQGFGEPLTTASPVLIVPLFTEYGDIDFGIALRPSDECSTAWAAEVEEGAT
jgi:CheY-specific phosphatase CheX